MSEVSTFRLYVLRAAYLLIAVGLALMVWPRLINHTADWALKHGDTFGSLAGIQVLAMLGIRYPLKMIQPGQSLLAIVLVDDIWVTANFKETQLQHMRPGQSVRIHVDAFDRDYEGTVENLPGAAGTLFSLLPPENASGNYVKVVQRLPVRIRVNPNQGPSARYDPVCRWNRV